MKYKRIISVILVLALLISGTVSILSIHNLQGNARVINYAGVVRGATQRLIKQELNHTPNDQLIVRLDGIITELRTGKGEEALIRLNNEEFQSLMDRMQEDWTEIKAEITLVRQGKDGETLYLLSEEYFELADRTVYAAEKYTEQSVRSAELGLAFLSLGILFLAALLAWYGSVQNRRQEDLQVAEDANRAKREYLDRMSEDLRAPMDDISELMYIVDLENYDLLFLNEAGKQTFGVKDTAGLKCYRTLHGQEQPCPYCNIIKMEAGETYTWEHTNELNGRHYLLKDRLIHWDGKQARMEIAFDITEAEQEKQNLQIALDAELALIDCVRTLYREKDPRDAIGQVLARLGSFLKADRTYILLIREDKIYNDYEWCAAGVASQKELLHGIAAGAGTRWQSLFDQKEYVIIEDIKTIKEIAPEEYALLVAQDIRTLVAVPLEEDGCLLGYLGVDNSDVVLLQNTAALLQTLSYFILLAWRRQADEQQLSHLSFFDTLTSFYNRNRYIQDSEALVSEAGAIGVVFVDVNGLKDINDQLGHAVGDKVLKECAEQMRQVFEEANYYRIGGDEFVIIAKGIPRETFEYKVQALRYQFGDEGRYQAAVGARWSAVTENVQQIIEEADAAMYEDKKEFYRRHSASNRYRHHNDSILHLVDPQNLQEKIVENQFAIYLQPKFSAADRSLIGAEALVRYCPRPDLVMLPESFLPLLEEWQLMNCIDFFVLEYVCAKLEQWLQEGKQVLPISINFSNCSLCRPDFLQRMVDTVDQYQVPRTLVEIEIIDSTQGEDCTNLKWLIGQLRQAGFSVSIDDFGTEYVNLALLSALEFDVLKLDRGMIEHITSSHNARMVMEATVEVCRKMGISIIAEGIETEEQLAILQDCGVELVQGFLFSQPIPIEEYEERYL